MTTIKQLKRLEYIHKYIKAARTGSPSEFAKQIGISESQWYNILEDLKIKGFPIVYSRRLKSYVYNDDCELEVVYSVQLLKGEEKLKIAGGYLNGFTAYLKFL